jgi:serine protease Do
LQLDDDSGLIVADVAAGGPAAAAGLQTGDVIRAIDGHRIDDLSYEQLYRYWYALPVNARVELTVWREGQIYKAALQTVLAPHDCERPSTLDNLDDQIVEPLALFGQPLAGSSGGVLVTARIAGPAVDDIDLQSGDVIKSVNRAHISSVVALRDAIAHVEHGHGAVLQVERDGALTYVDFER